MTLEKHDLEALERRGITAEEFYRQLEMLKTGFPYLKVKSAATVGNGITRPSERLEAAAINIWRDYLAAGGEVIKMVPASGAASRMFKDLFAFANGKSKKPDNDFMKKFFGGIEDFAFFRKLNFCTLELYGKSVDTMVREGLFREIVKALILVEGLNYGSLPKALLAFHKIAGSTRTALEEHLAEAAQYATCRDRKASVHFTVSENHIPLVERKIEEVKAIMEHLYGVKYDITLSIQKPSTDTVAANADGTPYRENGELFFRPGGHGALIENLGDLEQPVVFIKNIDNVVPDSKRGTTVRYKEILGGILVGTQKKMAEYLRALESGEVSDDAIEEMLGFVRNVLCITDDKADEMDRQGKIDYIFGKLNRPLRVCGMVKNEGEPGGGPFIVYNPDGTASPQILESTQFDAKDKKSRKMLKEATHFNPVDLVCYIRDFRGERFDLKKYVDPATGFISEKSREGVEIKALELPGLWNGAMSDWNTILVEVPAATFNPVKNVNDLLRDAHQI